MIPATVNAAAIRVHDHAARLATPGKRRSQRRAGELSVAARAGRPANHLASAKTEIMAIKASPVWPADR
jgi:hypothetical protein